MPPPRRTTGTSRSCLQVGAAFEDPPASAGDAAAPKATDAADATSFVIGVALGLGTWPNAFPVGVKKTTWPTLSLQIFQPSSWTRR